MIREDIGSSWKYLPDEVRADTNPVPTYAQDPHAERGFRLVYNWVEGVRDHRGGCHQDDSKRATWVRTFEWPPRADDDILSFRLVHDREHT